MEVDSPDRTAQPEQTSPRPPEPVARIPSEDVPGREISDLPRYPDSVRVEYERAQQDRLKIIRMRYLTRDGLDAARGFYRGVFRAKGWKVANVEFTEDRWTFLVLQGEREANIRIERYGRGATSVAVEYSEPLPEKKPAPEETPQRREARPAPPAPPQPATPTPAPAPQTASPAPQTASPAPGYDDDGGYGDDFGDNGGGDD
jgi:hypothetical protein